MTSGLTTVRVLSQEGIQVKPHPGIQALQHDEKEVLGVVEGPLAVEEGLKSGSMPESSSESANQTTTSACGAARGRRRMWYIWGGISCVLVVLIAVLSTVLGSRRPSATIPPATGDPGNGFNGTNPRNNSNTTSQALNNNTQLAAVSWKHTNSVRFDRLFYQDSNNNIRTSLYNSSHPVWHGSNISLAVARDRTPLAVAVNSSTAVGVVISSPFLRTLANREANISPIPSASSF